MIGRHISHDKIGEKLGEVRGRLLAITASAIVGRVAVLAVLSAVSLGAGDWPRFRGPNGSGVSSDRSLPSRFDPNAGTVWRTETPPGTSSPVVSNGRIYLTGHDGRKRITLCLDADTGEELWRQSVVAGRKEPYHPKGGPTSSTPATDGTNVYVFFPDIGLLAYGPTGEALWSVDLGPFQSIYGITTSPVLADDRVILNLDQLSGSYIAAFSTKNGEMAWRQERGESSGAISTPILVQRKDNPLRILVPGSLRLAMYDASNGKELFSLGGLSASSVSVPVVEGDAVYFAMGSPGGLPSFSTFDKDGDGYILGAEAPPGLEEAVATWGLSVGDRDGRVDPDELKEVRRYLVNGRETVIAVSLDGAGDQTDEAIRWEYLKGFPLVPSPLLYDGLLYLLKDGGIISALDPASGGEVKVGRLRGAIDSYFASPVAGGGHIYCASEAGILSVVRAGSDWTVLSTTDLQESIYATPAIYESRIFVRTAKALYAFGTPD